MRTIFSNKKLLKAGIAICTLALLAIYCTNLFMLVGTEYDPYNTIDSSVYGKLMIAFCSIALSVIASVIYGHILKSKKEYHLGIISLINVYVFVYALWRIFFYTNYAGILYAIWPLVVTLLAHYLLNENSTWLHKATYLFAAIFLSKTVNTLSLSYYSDTEFSIDLIFMMIVAMIPWFTSKHIKKSWRIIVPIAMVLLSFAYCLRTYDIIYSFSLPITEFNENSDTDINWLGYRLAALKAPFTGDLSFIHENFRYVIPRACPLFWYICSRNVVSAVLYGFFAIAQIILLLCFTIKTYKTEDSQPLLRIISATLLLSNVAGILLDMLFFTSSGVGITPVCNIFTFIPLTLLMLLPEKVKNADTMPFFIGSYTKTAKKKKITVSVPLKFWNYLSDDMWWYYVRDIGIPYDYLVICTPDEMEKMKKADDLLEPLYVRNCGKLEIGLFNIALPDCLFGYEPENYDVTLVGAGKHLEIWREEDFFDYTDNLKKETDIESILKSDIISGLDLEDLLKYDIDSLLCSDEDTEADEEDEKNID